MKTRVALVAALEVRINSLLTKIVSETPVDRAVVIKLHNGGSKLQTGITKYITVINERHNGNVMEVYRDFQHYPIDANYMLMIHRLVQDKLIIVDTKKMPEGLLKRRYNLDGIKSSIIFYIRETDGGLYYGSFSSTSTLEEITTDQAFARIENTIEKLRWHFKDAASKKILN